MQQGLESPSLIILAGLSEDEYSSVIEQYFKAALRELSIELPEPDERRAAIEIGVAIADEIIEGKRPVFEGVRAIVHDAIYAYPFYEETKRYMYDSIGFENVNGLFYTIDDLRDADNEPWQAGKTNRQLEEEVTQKMLEELKKWSASMKQQL